MIHNQPKNNSNPLALAHPEDYWKDEWVLSRKSVHAGGLIIDRHIKPADEIHAGTTNHHLMGYILNDLSLRQTIRMDDREFNDVDKQGDIWLKPSTTSGFWHWKSNNEALIFAIKPTFLQQVALENDCVNSDKVEILSVLKTRDPQLDFLAMQFKREIDNAEFGEQSYVESLANIFAIHLLRNYCAFPAIIKQYEGGLAPYKLRQALDYINDNLDQPIKLNEMAELLDLSQYYFCHLFKESMGVAPYKYVIQQRVEKAKSLIKHSNLPLADISYECGFSSQSQMTQHFRKSAGITPKVFRIDSR